MIIAKFGGTSVASKKSILTILDIVGNFLERRPVVVVSAVSGVTESLLALSRISKKQIPAKIKSIREIHQRLINDLFPRKETRLKIMNYLDEQLKSIEQVAGRKNLTPSDMDELASFGEVVSSYIIYMVLETHGIPSQQVIAGKMIITNDIFMNAEFLPKETERKVKNLLRPLIEKGVVPIVTGFIGSTKDGKITTLGRGGSDYSASIIGYSLDAEEVQIWTDVDGIYTADPKVVPSARLIPEISYKEASEMAAFGAKVLHPKTIDPVIQKGIPVRIMNTFNLTALGTLIMPRALGVGFKSISFKKQAILVNIYSTSMLFTQGFLARVFEIFASNNISIDLVSVSQVSVSVTLDNLGQLEKATKELSRFSTVSVKDKIGIVSLIGEKIASSQDLLADVSRLFHINHIPVTMISMGATDINISFVINSVDLEKAVRLIHDQILVRKI